MTLENSSNSNVNDLSSKEENLKKEVTENKTSNYTTEDYKKLCENEFNRFVPNKKKIGHALIKINDEGNDIAKQYILISQPEIKKVDKNLKKTDSNIEESNKKSKKKSNKKKKAKPGKSIIPKIRLMLDITKVKKYGNDVYLAHSPRGTKYAAKNILKMQVNKPTKESYEIATFEPISKHEFWGGKNENIKLFKSGYKPDIKKQQYKGGEYVEVHKNDVLERQGSKRKPTQNKVMRRSAVKDFANFLKKYKNILSDEFIKKLEKASNATLGKNIRAEWLHAVGFGLTPLNMNPQKKSNLGSGPKWANTEMMIVERMAKWFALNSPNTIIKIKPLFKMLLNSNTIEKINFDALFKNGNKEVVIKQEIHPFKKYPIYKKASDIAQGTFILNQFLNNKKPDYESKINDKTKKNIKRKKFK